MGARRSKSRAPGSRLTAAEVTLRGVMVRLREGVVHMGVGLRLVPALAEAIRGEAAVRCLKDNGARSGENCGESLTGVRRGVRRGAGEEGGTIWEDEDEEGPRKRSSSSSTAMEESGSREER